MKIFKYLFILFIYQIGFTQVPNFNGPVDLGIADPTLIDEASGLAASRQNKNIFWTHNDDPNENRIFAINNKAKVVAIYYYNQRNARDVEDIAIGPGPENGKDYIYLGDIGDNQNTHDKKYIYRFIEPKVSESQSQMIDTLRNYDIITYEYPDEKHDAEALMIDPLNKDIYVVSKRLKNEKVFRIAYPQRTDKTIKAELITSLPFGEEGFQGSGVTAGDISPDGSEILIKNYSNVFYFHRNSGETIKESLDNGAYKVNYKIEPQGEAIAWHPNSAGYYTISELSPFNIPAHLYYYEKDGLSVKKKLYLRKKKKKKK